MSSATVVKWVSVFGPAVTCGGREPSGGGTGGVSRRHDAAVSPASAEFPDSESRRLTVIDHQPVSVLLERLRNGDRSAFSAIYTALYHPLWRLVVILIRSATTADEVVQDVFVSLWLRREALRPDTDIRAYLYAAVRNHVRYVDRHDRVVTTVEAAVDRGALVVPAYGQTELSPDRLAEASEFSEAFQRALTSLTSREQQALQLRIEDELTFEEIGRLFGISKPGARKLVLRAEAKVRELLSAYRP